MPLRDVLIIKQMRIEIPEGVYRPAEDTFLLLDALNNACIRGKALDMGTGSGVIAVYLAKKGFDPVLGVDINPVSGIALRMNSIKNNIDNTIFVNCDLFSSIRGRFDLIAFNPPYLPEEIRGLANVAWAGGLPSGRRVIDRFLLDLRNYLSPKGEAYLLQTERNGVQETLDLLERRGLRGDIVAETRLMFERLIVFKIKLR
ncbi:MAG: HemK2/MTQ2 family protein methyltransferase [Candidatus Methanodesulfokora sp.]|jgi:release factor glutamine methyltransferase